MNGNSTYTAVDVSKDESLPYPNWYFYMTDNMLTPTTPEVPTDVLSAQGKISGKKQLKTKGKEYFSELGKRSAAKRKKDKRFGKKYYQTLARRAAESKRAKKEGRTLPPMEVAKSPLHTINKFLKGEF